MFKLRWYHRLNLVFMLNRWISKGMSALSDPTYFTGNWWLVKFGEHRGSYVHVGRSGGDTTLAVFTPRNGFKLLRDGGNRISVVANLGSWDEHIAPLTWRNAIPVAYQILKAGRCIDSWKAVVK